MKALHPIRHKGTAAPGKTQQPSRTKRGGRGMTLAALTLALGTAVYLNWSFAKQAPVLTATTGADGAVFAQAQPDEAVQTAGETTAVYDALPTAADAGTEADQGTEQSANKNYGEAQLVSVSQDSGSEFFEQARLARAKARDEALDTLEQALKKANLTQTEKQTLTAELSTQLGNVTKESDLETLIKAKGFADCVVMLTASGADVTVMTENDALTGQEVTQIRDAVLSRCADLTAQQITVVEVK